jgi:hypothetical protein
MTSDLEQKLSAGMREAVEGVTLSSDLLGLAVRRNRRRTALRSGIYSAGVIGVAAAVAVGLYGPPGHNTHRSPVASNEAPNVRLVAAVAATEKVSYHAKITWETDATNDQSPAVTGSTESAFDPLTATGYLKLSRMDPRDGTGFYEERLVDGTLFIGAPALFKQFPGRHARLDYELVMGPVGTFADPYQIFNALREAHAKITKTSGSTYHFEVGLNNKDGLSDTLVGDVTLVDERIGRVTYHRALQKGSSTVHAKYTLNLTGYGTPVTVQRPAKVIPVR